MTHAQRDIKSLIREAGGDRIITAECGLRRGTTKKWAASGIPLKHWPVILRLVESVTVDELYAANAATAVTSLTQEDAA